MGEMIDSVRQLYHWFLKKKHAKGQLMVPKWWYDEFHDIINGRVLCHTWKVKSWDVDADKAIIECKNPPMSRAVFLTDLLSGKAGYNKKLVVDNSTK
jgi:hypothetical protein